jgi:hypothetical protein
LGKVGETREEGVDEEPSWDRGYKRLGVRLHSIYKAKRKALSQEEISNK